MNVLPKEEEKSMSKPSTMKGKKAAPKVSNAVKSVAPVSPQPVPTPIEIEKVKRAKTPSVETTKITATNPGTISKNVLFNTLLVASVIILIAISSILVLLLDQLKKNEINFFSTNKTIIVDSTPQNANVYLDNVYKGITPLALENVNLSDLRLLKLRLEGYKDYTVELVKDSASSVITADLVPVNTPVNTSTTPIPTPKAISWTDFGIKGTLPASYTDGVMTEKVSCKDVKSYVIDKKKCPNDTTSLDYSSKTVLTDTGVTASFKLPTSANLCTSTASKCTANGAKKVDSFKFLDQNIDIYEYTSGDVVKAFAQPAIKVSGSDFNSVYVEFSAKTNYQNFFSIFTK